MTFLERFEKEHPAGKGERNYLKFCPHDFGYEPKEWCKAGIGIVSDCMECWEREASEDVVKILAGKPVTGPAGD